MNGSSFDREPMWKINRPVDEPLTKRERFAMGSWTEDELIQMARIITDEMNNGERKFDDYVNSQDPKVLAKARVRLADELLKELEATE